MKFTYLWQSPKKWTFQMKKVKRYIEKESFGFCLNLFAGKTKLRIKEIRVDSSNEFQPDYNMDSLEFIKKWEKEKKPLFDTIILDPPYNLRKANEKYKGHFTNNWIETLKIVGRILKPNGKIITLGFNSVGLSKSKGFEKEAICLICHGGAQNDTIIVIEKKIFMPIVNEPRCLPLADNPPRQFNDCNIRVIKKSIIIQKLYNDGLRGFH